MQIVQATIKLNRITRLSSFLDGEGLTSLILEQIETARSNRERTSSVRRKINKHEVKLWVTGRATVKQVPRFEL